jgi:hypothetical protein
MVDRAGSVVLTPAEPGTDTAPESLGKVKDALAAIDLGDGAGVSATAWLKACEACDVSEGTFYRHRKTLVETGQVTKAGTDHRPRYAVRVNDPE